MSQNLSLLSLLLLFFHFLSPPPAGAQEDLIRLQGKNRLLLVFAPSKAHPGWARQDALLAGSRAQFTDRDLLRFDFFERGGHRDKLRARYGIRPGSFRVLLIGKDGHVAFEGLRPVSLRDLTSRIDQMPMRREEMRRQGTRVNQ